MNQPQDWPLFRHPPHLSVDDADGSPARRMTADGPVEIWISAFERPNDPSLASGRLIHDSDGVRDAALAVMILTFPNYLLAERAAAALAEVLPVIEQLSREAIPTRDDGHEHEVVIERFSRSLPWQATCRVCMETLVEDVHGWYKDTDRAKEGYAAAENSTIASMIATWANRGRVGRATS